MIPKPPPDQQDGSFVHLYERWYWMKNGRGEYLVRCPQRALRKEPDFSASSWEEVELNVSRISSKDFYEDGSKKR